MTDSGFATMDEFWARMRRLVWIGMLERTGGDLPGADDMERRIRELIERNPPVVDGRRHDIEPFLRAVALEFGLDPDEFVQGLQFSPLQDQAERSAAVAAAEDLLRGEE